MYMDISVSLMYRCYIFHIYFTYIWGVKSGKTQYLATSFARRLLQGRRIYRFISIC